VTGVQTCALPICDHPAGNDGNQSAIAFDVMRKQNQEWKEEVQHKNADRHDPPSALQALMIEGDLFRQVSGPDDEQLREGEIRPKHIEGEEEFAEVVQVALLDELGKWFAVGEHHHDEN